MGVSLPFKTLSITVPGRLAAAVMEPPISRGILLIALGDQKEIFQQTSIRVCCKTLGIGLLADIPSMASFSEHADGKFDSLQASGSLAEALLVCHLPEGGQRLFEIWPIPEKLVDFYLEC